MKRWRRNQLIADGVFSVILLLAIFCVTCAFMHRCRDDHCKERCAAEGFDRGEYTGACGGDDCRCLSVAPERLER